MRKFWLRAALAASLLRGLCFGCALAVSWPFLVAARGFDALARPSGARQAGRRSPEVSTDAVRDVLAERRRQIEVEGWTPEHDDLHRGGDLALAAACYAAGSRLEFTKVANGVVVKNGNGRPLVSPVWPWAPHWWKPKARRHNLVRAGALILAEIERLDRALAAPEACDAPPAAREDVSAHYIDARSL